MEDDLDGNLSSLYSQLTELLNTMPAYDLDRFTGSFVQQRDHAANEPDLAAAFNVITAIGAAIRAHRT
jgi:hypothetical protein